MGSRYKTVKGFGYSEMFNDDEDTFVQNLVKTAGAAHTTTSKIMGPALLNINKSLNYKAFSKMDAAAISDIKIVTVDETKAMALVKDPDKLAFVSSTALGGFIGNAHCTIWSLYGDPFWIDCPSGWKDHGWSFGRITGVTPGLVQSTVHFTDCDGTVTDKVQELDKHLARTIVYSKTDGGTGELIVPSKRVESEEPTTAEFTFLSFMLKTNFVEVDDKHTRLLKGTFGIPQKTPDAKSDEDIAEEVGGVETLEDMIDDPTVKHIWVSYSAERLGDYMSIIDELLNLGDYGFESHGVEFIHTGVGTGAILTVDGEEQPTDEDQKAQYMIPMEWLFDRDLKIKYTDVEKCLKIWIFKEEKTKLKWYETGLFRILTWVVALVLAYFGQYQMLIGMISSTVINEVFGDKLGVVLNTVMVIYSFATGNIGSGITKAINLFSFVASIAGNIAKLYFMSESEKLASKAEHRDEEMEKTQDAIDELSSKNIYWAITDQLDSIHYTMYELPYAIYDAAYTTDRFLQLPRTTN